MDLLTTRDSWWMQQCEAVLASQGIDWRWRTPWQAGPRGVAVLEVAEEEVERARVALSELLAEDLKKRAEARAPERWVPLLLQPAFAAALCGALLLLAFYFVSGGHDEGSELFRRGAMYTVAFARGQWWRAVTAATLHADAPHVVGNVGFLLVLGWAAAERFGAGVSLFIWLATAVAGFFVSFWLSDATLTVGSSGGLFGLLGASGGHALRGAHRVVDFPWRERLRTGGAAVLLLAFTAFSPEANIAAHVGGFVVGFALGFMQPPSRRLSASWQVSGLLVSVALVAGAWQLAWA